MRLLLLVGIGILFGTGHWIWAVSILAVWTVLGWLVAWGLMYMVTNNAKEAAMYATLFTIPPLARLWLKKRPKTEIVAIDMGFPRYMIGDIIERWRHVDRIVGFDDYNVEVIKLGERIFDDYGKSPRPASPHLPFVALKRYVDAYGFQNVVVVDDGFGGPVPEGWRHEVV